jgi:WD40 repeat protein
MYSTEFGGCDAPQRRPQRRVRTPRAPLCLTLVGVLCLLSFAVPARGEGQNKIVYDVFDWSIYTSTHFDVYYYAREKDSLEKIVSMAESAYDELSRRLNYQVPKRIPLIFYATHADFEQNNVILNFIPEGVGAFAEPARNRMVLPIDLPDDRVQVLIQHELTHVFQYEILFGGRLARALTSNAPTWLMEGMASYFGNDEDEKDKVFVRDAVNSDLIPPITKVQIEGYPAYRFGHAFFDFLEAEWGKDAPRDFVYEYRSFLGRNVSQTLRRAFDVTPEDFNLKFRRYLRKKYLPLLAQKGEASEYGQRFHVKEDYPSYEVGTAASPSGDFVATLTTYKGQVDVALLSVKDRKLYKNLSSGRTTKYEYIVGQYLTTGPAAGTDLAYGPDGDRIAVFGRHERGRELLLFSVRKGGLLERIPVPPDQPLCPAFSPDGKTIAFAGTLNGKRDIFTLDLATRAVRNLSDDPGWDEAPVFSPDGRFIYHMKRIGGFSKIVRFPVDDPSKVEQVTWGDGHDEDPALSPDGKRLYFSSSRGGGIYNIYGQDLATGELLQYTDVIGSAFSPSAFVGPDGQEKIVFTGYQALRSQLYLADARKPFRRIEEKAPAAAALKPSPGSSFTPALEVTLDPEKVSRPKRFKLFLSEVGGYLGVDSTGTFYSDVRLDFSDYLGDERISFIFDSIYTYSNFQLGYYYLKKRLQWGVIAYDQRSYYVTQDLTTGQLNSQQVERYTGATLEAWYPFDRYTRVEGQVGFLSRKIPVYDPAEPVYDPNGNLLGFGNYIFRTDNVPMVGAGFSLDTVQYKDFGPWAGSGVDLQLQYLPDLKDGGNLAFTTVAQLRQYVPISRRVLLAFRGLGFFSSGNLPSYGSASGYDRLRAYPYGYIYGNDAWVVNSELRIPLIDSIVFPFLQFGGIRGRVFFDFGGAWSKGQSFQFWNSQQHDLQDGLADWGAGFTFYFFGIPFNIDFVWQLNSDLNPWCQYGACTKGMQTIFSIGYPTF